MIRDTLPEKRYVIHSQGKRYVIHNQEKVFLIQNQEKTCDRLPEKKS